MRRSEVIVLTQAVPRVERSAERVRARGIEPVVLSFLALEPQADAIARWRAFDVPSVDYVVFVSPSSVVFGSQGLAAGALRGRAAVIGPGTEEALRTSGVLLDGEAVLRPVAPPFDADAFTALPALADARGLSLAIVRAREGRRDWLDALRSRGAMVQEFEVCRQRDVEPGPEAIARIRSLAHAEGRAAIVITSSATASALTAFEPLADAIAWLRAQTAFVPHEKIAQALRDLGFARVVVVGADRTVLDAAIESMS